MDEASLRELLDGVRAGTIAPDDAVARLRRLPFADLGFARVDHHRALRQGLAEAVYGPGKEPDAGQRHRGRAAGRRALDRAGHPGRRRPGRPTPWPPTPAAPATAPRWCGARPPDPRRAGGAGHRRHRRPARGRRVRGRARRPTACARCASPTWAWPACTGCSTRADELAAADVVVVVAGMEGALASVVGGLTGAPVIAVPTSTGYGAGLDGRDRPAGHAGLVRGRGHRGRHRQRLRGGHAVVRLLGAPVPRHGPTPGRPDGTTPRPAVADPAQAPVEPPSPGSTASRASPATWPSARWSTPAPTSTRSRACSSCCPCGGWGARGRAGDARRHRRHQGPRRTPSRRAWCAPRPTSPAWSPRPGCPTGSSAGPWPPSTRWPRPRAACTADRPRASTSTRSGGIDAIIDVVGTCAALEVLGIDEVDASAVANGIGMVRAAHGLLPDPGPGGGRAAARRAHLPARRARSS